MINAKRPNFTNCPASSQQALYPYGLESKRLRSQKQPGSSPNLGRRNLIPAVSVRLLDAEARTSPEPKPADGLLSSEKYMGPRRQRMEKEMTESVSRLAIVENQIGRIIDHVSFDPVLKLWKRFINLEFPARD